MFRASWVVAALVDCDCTDSYIHKHSVSNRVIFGPRPPNDRFARVPLNPRQLIRAMLIATAGEPMSARAAVAACALFGIRENSVRVALVRLAAEGFIEAETRGTYRLG